MAILFVGVLEKTVLISKSMTSQEFEGIAADLQPTASQLQIVKDKLSIYYKKIIGEIYILVICQTQHPRQLVLALIEDLSERLGSEEAQLIKIESMSIDYKKIMEKYQGSQANIISNITGSNTNANNSSAMQNANQELAQVREIMQRNVEKVLARGERMDTLADRTAGLQRDSLQFR